MIQHWLLKKFSLREQHVCAFVLLYKVLCTTDDTLSGRTTEEYVITPDVFSESYEAHNEKVRSMSTGKSNASIFAVLIS